MFTDQKVDFTKFRNGWCVPPRVWKSHYMVRTDLTNESNSLCRMVSRYIPSRDSSGFYSLWHEESFGGARCKHCERALQQQVTE